MGIRIAVFVILSNVLELFFAHCAIKGFEGFCDLGLDICSASDVVLPCRESPGATSEVGRRCTPLFPRVGRHSP